MRASWLVVRAHGHQHQHKKQQEQEARRQNKKNSARPRAESSNNVLVAGWWGAVRHAPLYIYHSVAGGAQQAV